MGPKMFLSSLSLEDTEPHDIKVDMQETFYN
jgi:hypothetical protein